ncbi:MAG TPA: glycoside hydrolase family 15 protein [Bdellovibrionota bacterium]|nr:glycoside hydrolase family 15 protein [Bdellovibrionota bacterium]
MKYLSYGDYGVLGNTSGAAILSRYGSIDWCSLPYIDSPSHFSAFLTDEPSRFQIRPEGDFRSQQRPVDSTPVLETRFETPFGRGRLLDWMPIGEATLHREIEMLEGSITWALTCSPSSSVIGGLGAQDFTAEPFRGGVLFRAGSNELIHLRSEFSLTISKTGRAVTGRIKLSAGQRCRTSWTWGREPLSRLLASHDSVDNVIKFWKDSSHRCESSRCNLAGPWHDVAVRSATMIRLLTAPYSGALAEGIAVNLPELRTDGDRPVHLSERYAWIRDIALAMNTLAQLSQPGHWDQPESTRAAEDLFSWLADILERDRADRLQPAYLLDGGRLQSENVRALHEFQLDTYGQILLAAVEYYRIFGRLPERVWNSISDIADYVCQVWRRPDYGSWHFGHWGQIEISPEGPRVDPNARPEHFVASKLFCWVALDRACSLAESLGKEADSRWLEQRRILHRTICDQGYDSAQKSFVRSFSDRELDPTALFIALVGFLPLDDPRVTGTLEVIHERFSEGVFIYPFHPAHGSLGPLSTLEKGPGASLFYSFLYTSCLARAGRTDEARDRLAELCSYANPLGAFGEYVNPANGEMSGSFPSAEVHLALIQAVIDVGISRGRNFRYPRAFSPITAPPAVPKEAISA